MRETGVLLAAVLCLYLTSVGPVVGAGVTTADARLSGQVVDGDGTPVAKAAVLVEATNESYIDEQTRERDVVDTLRKLARADPDGLWVAETGADGRYSLSVPPGEYRVVAVVDERVSQRHRIAVDDGASRNLTVARSNLLSVDGSSATVRPDETATVSLTVQNGDDDQVRNLTLDLDVDDVLSVVAIDAPGATVTDGTVRYESLAPGENGTVRVTVRPPADAQRTAADVNVAAWSDTHFVDARRGASVAVRPEGSTPTRTVLPGGDGENGTTERSTPVHSATDDEAGTPSPSTLTDETGPGFVVPVAIVVLLGTGLLARRG